LYYHFCEGDLFEEAKRLHIMSEDEVQSDKRVIISARKITKEQYEYGREKMM